VDAACATVSVVAHAHAQSQAVHFNVASSQFALSPLHSLPRAQVSPGRLNAAQVPVFEPGGRSQ
jgi:hypothetical protein